MDMPELENLLQKYPDLFPKNEEGEPCFYFECDNGWYGLIDTLLSFVNARVKYYDATVERNKNWEKLGEVPDWITKTLDKYGGEHPLKAWHLDQVKEKFGTLRFYSAWFSDQFQGAVSFAESYSALVCEICGKPGELYRAGWLKTLCPEHTKERQKQQEEYRLRAETHRKEKE
jgi:hypothetical protein